MAENSFSIPGRTSIGFGGTERKATETSVTQPQGALCCTPYAQNRVSLDKPHMRVKDLPRSRPFCVPPHPDVRSPSLLQWPAGLPRV